MPKSHARPCTCACIFTPQRHAPSLSAHKTFVCLHTICRKVLYEQFLSPPRIPRQDPRCRPPSAAYIRIDGDVVLLRLWKDSHSDGTLIKLQASKNTGTHRGTISHADIIGKEPRQTVRSSKGHSYRIHEPTLADYVRLTPRLVTPVRLGSSNQPKLKQSHTS